MNSNEERLGIMQLGVWLARKWRLPVKLSVLAATLLIPLLIVVVILLQRQSADIRVTRSEIDGVAVIRPLMQVVTQVQLHRGQTNLLLAGNASASTALEKTRADLTQAATLMTDALKATRSFDVNPQWTALLARVQSLPAQTQSGQAAASFKTHSDLVRDLRQFVYAISDFSGLLYDPDPTAYLLMDVVVSRSIAWSEQLGQMRGAGAGLLAKIEPNPQGDGAMQMRLNQLTDLLGEQLFMLEILKRNGESNLGGEAAVEESTRFGAMVGAAFSSAAVVPRDVAAYFAAGTRAIELVLVAQTRMTDRLELTLTQRASGLARFQVILISGCTIGFLFLFYLIASLYQAITIDLKRLSYAMGELARGNLRVTATVRSNDEIGELAVVLRSMISNVSSMVAAVGSDAALVAHAGHSLGVGNRDLADRTEQQAANLEQTAASVQELASTVQQNANIAREVDIQAVQVRDIAEAGAQAMSSSIASVELIQQSASRMNEIIGVIDGLAFQTNILALNAAVEAARAGELGRGFAVVASEVRSLAQRSAGSAREIRNLIQTSSNQVASSVTQIRVAGDGMTKIVSGIRSVSASISQISTASADQSTGIREISAAVAQLDELTQRNAAMVERAVSQSDGLQARGASLSDATSSFKLLQGVADEAVALVQRASQFRANFSSKDAFLRALTDKTNGFVDRDMYVFVLDSRGTYLAFAGNTAKVGTRVQDVPGIDGDGLTRDIVAQATEGGGWVEYDITNPTTGKVQTKMSFVEQVDDAYLGCGVYKTLSSA